jgi:hypothetical protein
MNLFKSRKGKWNVQITGELLKAKSQMTRTRKSNPYKNRNHKSVESSNKITNRIEKPKRKKKDKYIKKNLLTMIFFWILAILLIVSAYLKTRHFITEHW